MHIILLIRRLKQQLNILMILIAKLTYAFKSEFNELLIEIYVICRPIYKYMNEPGKTKK